MLTMLALLALQMQVHYALDLPNLRRGRKRKSADPDDGAGTTPRFNDWTHEEDVKLLEVIWSGARGVARCIPGRSYEVCKKRLQRIKKQLSGTKVVDLHDHASPDAVRVVTTVLRDSQYLAAVDEARDKLKERGSDTTELPDTPPPAEEMPPDVTCEECETESAWNASNALSVIDACANMMRAPAARATDTHRMCSEVCTRLHSSSAVDPTTAKNDRTVLHAAEQLRDAVATYMHAQRDATGVDFMADYALSRDVRDIHASLLSELESSDIYERLLRKELDSYHRRKDSTCHAQKWNTDSSFRLIMSTRHAGEPISCFSNHDP